MKELFIFCLLLFLAVGQVRAESKPLEVVSFVDINRYLGTWYEIATIPARFQKNCVAVTATYGLRDDGKISVINKCREGTLDGKFKSIKGKAWVVDKKTNAKLKVQFFWPFSGDYWIIELDPDYQYAVVGHPQRKYLWILNRSLQMDDTLYEELIGKIAEKGYDVTKIKKTLQPQIKGASPEWIFSSQRDWALARNFRETRQLEDKDFSAIRLKT